MPEGAVSGVSSGTRPRSGLERRGPDQGNRLVPERPELNVSSSASGLTVQITTTRQDSAMRPA